MVLISLSTGPNDFLAAPPPGVTSRPRWKQWYKAAIEIHTKRHLGRLSPKSIFRMGQKRQPCAPLDSEVVNFFTDPKARDDKRWECLNPFWGQGTLVTSADLRGGGDFPFPPNMATLIICFCQTECFSMLCVEVLLLLDWASWKCSSLFFWPILF